MIESLLDLKVSNNFSVNQPEYSSIDMKHEMRWFSSSEDFLRASRLISSSLLWYPYFFLYFFFDRSLSFFLGLPWNVCHNITVSRVWYEFKSNIANFTFGEAHHHWCHAPPLSQLFVRCAGNGWTSWIDLIGPFW